MPKQNLLSQQQIQVIYEMIKERIDEILGIKVQTKDEIHAEYHKLTRYDKQNLFTKLQQALNVDKQIIYNYVRYHFGLGNAGKIQKKMREKISQQISNLQEHNYNKEQIWEILREQYKDQYDKEKLYNCFKYIFNQQWKARPFTFFNQLDEYEVDNQMQQSLIGHGIEIEGLWDYLKDQLYLSEPFLEQVYL